MPTGRTNATPLWAQKKSSHRRGRNLWKPWSRGILAPMAPILVDLFPERKDIPQKFSLILRESGWTGRFADIYTPTGRVPGPQRWPRPQFFDGPADPLGTVPHSLQPSICVAVGRAPAVSGEVGFGSQRPPENWPRRGSPTGRFSTAFERARALSPSAPRRILSNERTAGASQTARHDPQS